MLRSKTKCKTELISRKERKTYFLPPFAISQNSQGSEVFSPAYTACTSSFDGSSKAKKMALIDKFKRNLLKTYSHTELTFQAEAAFVKKKICRRKHVFTLPATDLTSVLASSTGK
jgi:hypothetical protein